MSSARLSPAMLNTLRQLVAGHTPDRHVDNRRNGHATRLSLAALQQRGLIRADWSVTDAGRAVFAPCCAATSAESPATAHP
jgi:hypothetical protein